MTKKNIKKLYAIGTKEVTRQGAIASSTIA